MHGKNNKTLETIVKTNEPDFTPVSADLEKQVSIASIQSASPQTRWQKVWNYGKNYIVDTSAGSIYYTLLMTPVELGIFQFDFEKLAKSRLYAIGVGFATHWFYRVFRHAWATKIWKAGPESSQWKKNGAEYTARLLFQVPFYICGLVYANATPLETSVAVPIGFSLGIITAAHYGKVLERWRKYWGLQTTLYK